MTYTKGLIKAVLNDYKKGLGTKNVCIKYSIPKATLFSWINKNNINKKRELKMLNTTKQYKSLELKYNKTIREKTILDEALDLLHIPLDEKMRVSDILLEKYPLKEIARILHYSGSTFYNHVHNRVKITKIQQDDIKLKPIILKYFNESNQRLSIEKMHYLLRSKEIKCSQARISRLMKEMNLKCKRSRKPRIIEKEKPSSFPKFNKLKQQFNQPAPNLFWSGDVTMFKINDNKFYMAVVIELYSRMVIGYHLSTKNDEALVITALKNAYEFRNRPTGVTFHSDQGSTYKSIKYTNLLHTLKISQSFSKKGTPYDNSAIEAFFSNLKQGDLYNRDFKYFDDLKAAVNDYVNYYNTMRPHKALGFKTPLQYEIEYIKKKSDL